MARNCVVVCKPYSFGDFELPVVGEHAAPVLVPKNALMHGQTVQALVIKAFRRKDAEALVKIPRKGGAVYAVDPKAVKQPPPRVKKKPVKKKVAKKTALPKKIATPT